MGEPERRRRRLRPHSSAAPAEGAPAPDPIPVGAAPAPDLAPVAFEDAVTPPIEEPGGDVPPTAPRPVRSGPGGRPRPVPGADDREVERGLRGLVGSGSSQVSVGAALRARDAARPTDAQLADAERNLTIVRRNWAPREDLPRNR
jgi:hypothetical protein